MPIVISNMVQGDTEAVREILADSELSVDLEAELERSWAVRLVARIDDQPEPVGFLLAWRAADELHLIDLGTRAGFRRRGVGRALALALLAHARAVGARLVVLELRCSNSAAQSLYEGLGFVVSGQRKGYYSDTGEDAVEMRLDLR